MHCRGILIKNKGVKMITKHILYIGLNDKDTKQQEITTLDAYKIIQNCVIAVGYDGATITEATGIYKHDDGAIVIEKSLEVSILCAEDRKTTELVERIKTALNQESIAVQKLKINSELV